MPLSAALCDSEMNFVHPAHFNPKSNIMFWMNGMWNTVCGIVPYATTAFLVSYTGAAGTLLQYVLRPSEIYAPIQPIEPVVTVEAGKAVPTVSNLTLWALDNAKIAPRDCDPAKGHRLWNGSEYSRVLSVEHMENLVMVTSECSLPGFSHTITPFSV